MGAATETVASRVMEHRLGDLAAPYRSGRSGGLSRAALSATGADAVLPPASRRRSLAIAAAALTFAGSALERFAVFEAGPASARGLAATIAPQRRRLERLSRA